MMDDHDINSSHHHVHGYGDGMTGGLEMIDHENIM
jgi:hypothetical protein